MTVVRLERQTWTWADPMGLTHVLFVRHTKWYATPKIDYVTGCGLDVGIDDVPKRSRLVPPARCLRCAVTRMVDVINQE